MSGPKDGQGEDAFDDFFGDPSPSGRMGPAQGGPEQEIDPDDEPTQDVDLTRAATPAQEAQPTTRRTPDPAPPATPAGAVPDDWWDPEPQQPAPAGPTWASAPTQAPPASSRPPRRGISPFAMVAMLVGGVLLGGLCVGGTVMALNDDEPVASHTTVTETSSETPTSTTPPSTTTTTTTSSTSSTTKSSSSSSSSSPTRSGERPAGVKNCAGPKWGTSVGRGSSMTTCDFALAVRDSYLARKPKGDVQLQVRSPVTKKTYTMSCTGVAVTRCTGGNDAVVVLY